MKKSWLKTWGGGGNGESIWQKPNTFFIIKTLNKPGTEKHLPKLTDNIILVVKSWLSN